ncbi:MAG: hypothetical protein HN608_03825, partial [Rhodospirillaceae bacterium]|nr:hypothetical protein [Rhodospirillaceae bacterium]
LSLSPSVVAAAVSVLVVSVFAVSELAASVFAASAFGASDFAVSVFFAFGAALVFGGVLAVVFGADLEILAIFDYIPFKNNYAVLATSRFNSSII